MRGSKLVENIKRKLFVVAYKHLDVDLVTEATLNVKKEEVSYFPFSHNTIKIISQGNNVFFFRECLQHGNFKSRIDRGCKEFLEMLRGEVRVVNFAQEIPIQTKYTEDEIIKFEAFIER